MNYQLTWKPASAETLRSAVPTTDATGKSLARDAFDAIAGNSSLMHEAGSIVIPAGEVVQLIPLHAKAGLHILDIHVGAGATLQFPYLNTLTDDGETLLIIRAWLEEGATLKSTHVIFGGRHSALFAETHLNGAHAQTVQHNIFFGAESQRFDLFSSTYLHAKNCSAQISAKGVLLKDSYARFDGGIVIDQSAPGGTGQLDEHTLLLSDCSTMDAIPRLKISTNDVKAGHSASVTRVDDEQLFYAASRGIGEKDATRIIAEGFLNDAFAKASPGDSTENLVQDKLKML